MYYIEKNIVNNCVFFVIRSDKDFKIKDFYFFGEKDYCPIFEDYVLNLFDNVLQTEFLSSRFTSKKFRKTISLLYKIDIKSNRKIDYRSSFFFYDLYKIFYEPFFKKYQNYFLEKKTQISLDRLVTTCCNENLCYNDEANKMLNQFYRFFGCYGEKNVRTNLIKFLIEEDYQKGKTSVLKFDRSIKTEKQKIKNLELYKKYISV